MRTVFAGPLLPSLACPPSRATLPRNLSPATCRRQCLSGLPTGLIQAYGLITSDLTSTTRAPGGTFGNRNFLAHLTAIGLPLVRGQEPGLFGILWAVRVYTRRLRS